MGRSFLSRRASAVLHPALIVQTVTYSIGQGLYTACSVVYFTLYVGLSAAQVAVGFSVTGLVSLILWVPFGALSDHLGGRKTWIIGAVLQAILFAYLPFVHGFCDFLFIVTTIGLSAALGSSGRVRYIGELAASQNRVKVNAYLRSLSNVGSTLGILTAGVVVGLESRSLIISAIWVNAFTFALDVVLLARYAERNFSETERIPKQQKGRRALNDRSFLILSLVTGVFAGSDLILSLVIPLWILQKTDAPRFSISVVLAINTVMVILLQVRASSGADDITGAIRCQRRAGIFLAAACAVLVMSAYVVAYWTVGLLVVGTVFLTIGEMYSSASAWGLSYGLSPETRRGEYLAVFRWGEQLTNIVGPVCLTALALHRGGWLIIATIFALAGVVTPALANLVLRSRMADSVVAAEHLSS